MIVVLTNVMLESDPLGRWRRVHARRYSLITLTNEGLAEMCVVCIYVSAVRIYFLNLMKDVKVNLLPS